MTEQHPDDRFKQAKAAFLEGLERYREADFARAEQHYLRSLGLVPGRASTLVNLAATQLRLARPRDALATADLALAAEADSTDALLHRGTALAQLGRSHEALAAFERLLALDPTHAPAWSSSGSLLREMQRLGEAADAFRAALRHGAEADLHTYYLASVGAGGLPPTAPEAYVQRLFDDYADEFERHLVERLHYQGHRRLLHRLVEAAGACGYESALDLGCGTGLCGPLARPAVKRLTGVDLSARMLEKARALGVYDRLEQADIARFLNATDERYDLILAADVFIYIGDLEPVFEGARRAMDSGVFCFSVEAVQGGDADYQLLPSLRYAHSEHYLARLAEGHGFDIVAIESGPVRQDQRETIDGMYVYLRRAAAPARIAARP